MASLGFWNLIVIAVVALVLRHCWQWDDADKEIWRNSDFLKHPFVQKITDIFRNPFVKIALQVMVILIVTRWLIYTGWVAYRLTQPDAPFWDFKQFYIVSNLILQKVNPYDPTTYTNAQCQLVNECYTGAFIYPPNILPFVWFLGYFSLEGASTIWMFIHLATIGFILWGVNLLLTSKSIAIRTICTIVCALIYGVVFDLRVGNVSSIVAALLVWSVIFAQKNKDVPAGILLGISTIKPTISGLFFLYFLLKRHWKILGWCLGLSLLLSLIGFWLTGGSPIETMIFYKIGYQWTFQNHPSGNPFIAPARIDLGVIGPRLFPNYPVVAKLLSGFLSIILLFYISQFLFQRQVINHWTRKIYLSEITLIGCLSILIFYAQRHTTVMLVFAVVFFLNYLLWEIRKGIFSQNIAFLWGLGGVCLLLHTGFIYFQLLEPLEVPWKQGKISYLIRITIGSLPNYSLLGLIVIILLLSKRGRTSN